MAVHVYFKLISKKMNMGLLDLFTVYLSERINPTDALYESSTCCPSYTKLISSGGPGHNRTVLYFRFAIAVYRGKKKKRLA